MDYIPKVGRVYITTLTLVNTWYAVLTPTQAKGIRGFKIKSRYVYGQQSGLPFDYAFSAVPGNDYWSNTGSGSGDEAGPVRGIWARAPVAGTVIELMTYD